MNNIVVFWPLIAAGLMSVFQAGIHWSSSRKNSESIKQIWEITINHGERISMLEGRMRIDTPHEKQNGKAIGMGL